MEPGFDRALELAARRQARRRSFNARLTSVDAPEAESGLLSFRCECGLIGCSSSIQMTAREHADLRVHPDRFAVLAEHLMPEAEALVAVHRGWAIVEKHPGPGAVIAVRTAARATQRSCEERAR